MRSNPIKRAALVASAAVWLVAGGLLLGPSLVTAAVAPICRCSADCLLDDCSCWGTAGCYCGCSFLVSACECY